MTVHDSYSGRTRTTAPKPANRLKHYKARIENPWDGCHAMELYLVGKSILSVGNDLVSRLSELNVDESQVTKLIEIDDQNE